MRPSQPCQHGFRKGHSTTTALQEINDHIDKGLNQNRLVERTVSVAIDLRKIRQGVPQGGVLSPVLFNLYMSKMPLPPGNIKLVTYADDSNVLKSGVHLGPICQELNIYLGTLENWFSERNLFISPTKSTATVFTT